MQNNFFRDTGSSFNGRGDEMFEEEEVEGDEAFAMPGSPEKRPLDDDLGASLTDARRRNLILRMEQEGLNFSLFFKYLKGIRKGDSLQLGSLLQALETNYPFLEQADRVFLVKDCITERSRVDYGLLEELFTRHSKQLKPSAEQTLTVLATSLAQGSVHPTPEKAIRAFLRDCGVDEYDKIGEDRFIEIFTGQQRVRGKSAGSKFASVDGESLSMVFQCLKLDSNRRLLGKDLQNCLVAFAQTRKGTLDLNAQGIAEVGALIPGYAEMSPRTRYEEVAMKLLAMLEERRLKPLDAFRMADTSRVGRVNLAILQASF